MTLQKIIGSYCRKFRTEVLGLTLEQLEFKTLVNLKTLSAFENGNSSNLNLIDPYIKACNNIISRRVFIHGISNVKMEYYSCTVNDMDYIDAILGDGTHLKTFDEIGVDLLEFNGGRSNDNLELTKND